MKGVLAVFTNKTPDTPWAQGCLRAAFLIDERATAALRAQVLAQELTAPGYEYDSGLRDQNAIVYLLKRDWAQHAQRVLLVNAQYCLNCYWRDLLQQGDLASSDKAVRAARGAPLLLEP